MTMELGGHKHQRVKAEVRKPTTHSLCSLLKYLSGKWPQNSSKSTFWNYEILSTLTLLNQSDNRAKKYPKEQNRNVKDENKYMILWLDDEITITSPQYRLLMFNFPWKKKNLTSKIHVHMHIAVCLK